MIMHQYNDNESYNDNEMSNDILEWYNASIINFYESVKNQLIKRNIENDIEPQIAYLSEEAKIEWIRIFNDITNVFDYALLMLLIC